MSIPIENARRLLESMRSSTIRNLIAQSKAKQVLREVREAPENFPSFSSELDDRVTFVAYGLLGAGCSLIEGGEVATGRAEIQAAADILEAAHRTEIHEHQASRLHCLVGAMAFYACGQYSRAFVLIGNIDDVTPSARIIASFLRKNRGRLVSQVNSVLLAPSTKFEEARDFDEWALTVCLARAVSLAAEHSISGEAELLAEADSALRDAMTLSEGCSHPAFWWLARLLRLMLMDYGSGSLWKVLPPFFGPYYGLEQVESYVKLLALSKPPVIEVWESQIAALQLVLDPTNQGGVINLRTSAGKTRVAELAILKTLRNDPNAKILYLAPFRSLAFELERTFSRVLVPLGFAVSHLYGGSRFSGVDLELVLEGQITIATPEKAKAMLRAAPDLFDTVKLVVIDEGHMLGGNERNVRNELFIEHLRLLARQHGARILLLSAVLPNAEDLAAWVGGNVGALAKSNWKPSAERFGTLRWSKSGVKIEWLGHERCFNPHFVEFKRVPKGKTTTRVFPGTKTEAVAATAARLAELGPVLIFAGQARWVSSMGRAVLVALGSDAPLHPWPTTEWGLFEAVCKEELGDNSFEFTAARFGVVCHSNKLPPQVRICVEKLMAKCSPRVIVATTTLGQGVNIGISSVIVATTWIGESQITKRDFWNICGRAGRAFVDGEGKVLFAIDMTRKPWQVRKDEADARNYFDIAHLDQVQSGLLQLIRVLHQLASQVGISFETLLEFCANDSFDPFGTQKATIETFIDLIDDHLLALHVDYKGDDLAATVDWVDDAFRTSLAAIQEVRRKEVGGDEQLIAFLKARVTGVLRKAPTPEGRRAIIASGLPLSVGIVAFNQLNVFREMVDHFLATNGDDNALAVLVVEFETWARVNAKAILGEMPDQATLDIIRPQWLAGVSLRKIIETCGEDSNDICNDLYGYELSWLFHSIAQKLNKADEESRIEALSKAGLLVELGLPTEAAAKVFLAGVRSRTAAVELSKFVTDTTASVSAIRNALLDPKTIDALSPMVSESTLEWLLLLSTEHGAPEPPLPECARFSLKTDAPDEIKTLHVRKRQTDGELFLYSTDLRFNIGVQATEKLPFDKLADNPSFVFVRDGKNWVQHCRDPRIRTAADLMG